MNPGARQTAAPAGTGSGRSELAADVRAGLGGAGQKTLPSRYLYDALGSALFEAITRLPEYGLTRADARLLSRHAGELADRLPGPVVVAELGSGTGEKTRPVLEALARRAPLAYHPIDISRAALVRCAQELGALPGVRLQPCEADYLDGLGEVAAARRRGMRVLVLFVGSTIGNFDPPAAEGLLRDVRGALQPGDALLLGTDLVKDVPRMLAAYDDALGVTAAFDRNLLVRLNRELGADFDVAAFSHQARWEPDARRIEMHLVSTRDQRARVRAADLEVAFRAGESIWTESSHKFLPEEPARLARLAGFRPAAAWTDEEWPFAESLLVADGS